MLLVGHLNLKCASIWLGNENVKLTVFPVKLLHNWLAQLLVVHQLTCDYRPSFPGICDATNALLIYAVIWTFISNSVRQCLKSRPKIFDANAQANGILEALQVTYPME